MKKRKKYRNSIHYLEEEILKDLKEEEEKVLQIKTEVDQLCDKIIHKSIEHFSTKDVISAFFGALIIGLTFLFKGLLVEVAINLPWKNIFLVFIATLIILAIEIYIIGYSRVRNKRQRPAIQFVLKRLVTMYIISISVSFLLLIIFNFIYFSGSLENFIKLVFVIAMPCSIGAAISNMLKS